MNMMAITPALFSRPASRALCSSPCAMGMQQGGSQASRDTVFFSGQSGSTRSMPGYNLVESEPLRKRYKGPATPIEWDHWAVSALKEPLATTGLEMCRAVIMTDGEQQFLAHVLPEASAEDIISILNDVEENYDFDVENSEVFVMQGSQDNPELDANILDAVEQFGQDAETVRFLHRPGNNDSPVGVAMVDGEVYLCSHPRRPAVEVEQYPIGS